MNRSLSSPAEHKKRMTTTDTLILPPAITVAPRRRPLRHGYLIDMDGVLYRGSQMIEGADRFVRNLRRRRIPFRFLTNNSQRTRRDIVAKLARMNMDVEENHVYTCAMATATYLERQKPRGTAFVIGEGGLLTALHMHGYAVVDHDPDYVVVGEGRTFNLEQVEAAVTMIHRGASWLRPISITVAPRPTAASAPAAVRWSQCSKPRPASRRSPSASPARS